MAISFKRASIVSVALGLFACGGGTPAPVHDAKADSEMQANLKRRNDLQAEFKAAPADYRKKCELTAGDCRLDVKDGRDKILRKHPLVECRSASDSDAEFACVAEKLTKEGQTQEPSDYYKLDSWCLERMVACTAKLSDDAAGDSKKALAQSRIEHVTSSRRALVARAQVGFAEEKIAYLRSMLPPQADGVCPQADDFAKCKSDAQATSSKFDREIAKDEGSYNENDALAAYEVSRSAEAACHEPAFKCLKAKLDTFGGTSETHAYMDQALKSLERRARLVAERGEDEAKSCLSRGLSKYQSRIIGDYQKFSHEPVLFFQAQLHRDFRALYDTQSTCLQSRSRGGTVDASAAAEAPSGSRKN
ncbi:MAG: hypothetical protein QM756_40440 [Polyangiaceae bacterium]